jgi:hypothetical protein
VRLSLEEVAAKLIGGLEAVLEMESPYPPEYREMVYRAARYFPGGSFEELLTESELQAILERLKGNGTI